MSRLIESIRLEDNQLKNLDFHNERFNRSRHQLFSSTDYVDLKEKIIITGKYQDIQRVRITYGKKIEKVEILPYQRRTVTSCKIVFDNDIDYQYKYADKSMFAKHLTEDGCEIIIIKNGLITDTSFSNIVFYDGVQWHTPAKPLLKGTMRAYLLDKGLIIEKDIPLEMVKSFKKLRFINAFNGFENPFELDIQAIRSFKEE